MKRIRRFLILRLALLWLGLMLLPMALSVHAKAQGQDIVDDEIVDVTDEFCDPENGDDCEVESIADIMNSTDDVEIDTYNATFITFDLLDYGYEAYVEGYLYQDGPLYADGAAYDDGSGAAELDGANTLTVNDFYELDTDSYLFDGFDYYYILSSEVDMDATVPALTSVSPTDASVGTSGTLTLSGSNLLDPFGGNSYVNYSGSGVTFSVVSANAQSAVLNYTIADNATTGSQTFSIQDRFGTSNTVAFNVGDPTPVVTSVSPGTWQAGTQFTVTVSGQHFGTNPSVSLLGGAGVTISAPTSAGDTQLQATVTVSQSAPAQTVTVQVQSNGYLGNGFISTYPGQSPDGTDTAVVNPIEPLPPQIMIGSDSEGSLCNSGTNVAGTTQTVYTGQQISVTGCIPLAGVGVTSASWSPTTFAATTAVAGFSVGAAPGYTETITQVQATECPGFSAYCDLAPFYWVAQGNQTLTFTYELGNGTAPASATVTFNATGPSGYQAAGGVTTTTGNVNTAIVTPQGGAAGPQLIMQGLANPNGGFSGIQFLASGTEPADNAGTYSWAQLVNSDMLHIDDYYGRGACTGGPTSPQLDTMYPYGPPGVGLYSTHVTNDTALDAPGWKLAQSQGEVERVFSATMFLMWMPNADSGCTNGSACTIPVPLGSLNWNLNGDAVNTLNPNYNQTTWGLNCEYPRNNGQEQVTFTPSTAYPVWNAVYQGSQMCP